MPKTGPAHRGGRPLEEHNLYLDATHSETVASLKERLLQWLITADEADQIADKWLE